MRSLLLILIWIAVSSTSKGDSVSFRPPILNLASFEPVRLTELEIDQVFHEIWKRPHTIRIKSFFDLKELPNELVFQSALLKSNKLRILNVSVNDHEFNYEILPDLGVLWLNVNLIQRHRSRIKIEYQFEVDSRFPYIDLSHSQLLNIARYRKSPVPGWDLRKLAFLSHEMESKVGASVRSDDSIIVSAPHAIAKSNRFHLIPTRETGEFSVILFDSTKWKFKVVDVLGTKFSLILPRATSAFKFKDLETAINRVWPEIVQMFAPEARTISIFEDPMDPVGGGTAGTLMTKLSAMQHIPQKISEILNKWSGWPEAKSTKELVSKVYKYRTNYWDAYTTHIIAHELMHYVWGWGKSWALLTRDSYTDSFFLGMGIVYDVIIAKKLTGFVSPLYDMPMCSSFYSEPRLDQGIFFPDVSKDSSLGMVDFQRRNCYSHFRAANLLNQMREEIGTEKFDAIAKKYLNLKSPDLGYLSFRLMIAPEMPNLSNWEIQNNVFGTGEHQ